MTLPFTVSTNTTVPSRLVPKAYFPSEVVDSEVMASGWDAISCNGSASDEGSNIRRCPSEDPEMRCVGVYESAQIDSGWTGD
jgi:hypothetical protein